MKKCHTITGKLFYYQGDLDHGLVIHTSDAQGNPKVNVSIYISLNEIKVIRHQIQQAYEIPMGACRDNPSQGSVGHILLNQHKKSRQHLSYVIPLLVGQGFCTTVKRKTAIILRYQASQQDPTTRA